MWLEASRMGINGGQFPQGRWLDVMRTSQLSPKPSYVLPLLDTPASFRSFSTWHSSFRYVILGNAFKLGLPKICPHLCFLQRLPTPLEATY